MKRRVKRSLQVVSAVLALGSLLWAAVALRSAADIPAGTGYAAWDLCTRTLQDGEDFERVKQFYVVPKLKQLPSIWTVEYRPRESVTVGTWLPGLAHKRTALYRPGLGCTIIPPDENPQAVRAQRLQLRPDAWRDPLPWPQGEGAAEPAAASVSQRAIVARHAQRMFAEPVAELSRHQNTTALLVASHGHLLHEQYAEGFTREQTQLGWSMTKSLTSIIAGVFVRDQRLSLDAPVGLAQWQGTDKAKITWRQLLNMAPGLAWDEGYGGASDATEMLFSRANQAGWAADRPLTSKPGSVFTYSTGTANIAMLGMRQLLGGSAQTIYDFYQEALFEPLGIHRGVIEPDASGTPVGGARGNLRPVDWLRLGQLVANHGAWNGELIIAQDYLQFMLAASPANAGYGGMIWRQPAQEITPALRERLPGDLVYFAGHLGQFLIIVPSARLVVLRMGVAFHYGPAREEALELVADLLQAG